MIAPTTSAIFGLGGTLSMQGFVAIAIGGFGSQFGALVGGVTLGVVQAEALVNLDSAYRNLVSLALLMVVLLVRPAGLFGRRHEREV